MCCLSWPLSSNTAKQFTSNKRDKKPRFFACSIATYPALGPIGWATSLKRSVSLLGFRWGSILRLAVKITEEILFCRRCGQWSTTNRPQTKSSRSSQYPFPHSAIQQRITILLLPPRSLQSLSQPKRLTKPRPIPHPPNPHKLQLSGPRPNIP